MRLSSVFLFCVVLILASCATPELSEKSIILNQSLVLAQKNYHVSWNKKRSKLEFDSGKWAENCAEYTALLSKDKISESVNNQLVKSEYLICDALSLLGDKPANTRKSSLMNLGGQLAKQLDFRSFPSSLFRVSSESKHTLSTIDAKNVTSHGTITTMETKGWVIRMEVVAIAELNGNDNPDWVIWLSDEAKQGNYRSYTTLVAFDVNGKSDITASAYSAIVQSDNNKEN